MGLPYHRHSFGHIIFYIRGITPWLYNDSRISRKVELLDLILDSGICQGCFGNILHEHCIAERMSTNKFLVLDNLLRVEINDYIMQHVLNKDLHPCKPIKALA